MRGFTYYAVTGLPDSELDGGALVGCIGRRSFVLVYDLSSTKSLLGFEGPDAPAVAASLMGQAVGVELEPSDFRGLEGSEDCTALCAYRLSGEGDARFFYDLFQALPREGFVAILFMEVSGEELGFIKAKLERMMSLKNVKETESSRQGHGEASHSIQRDLYHDSEERMMLAREIESLNAAMLSGSLAHKIAIVVPKRLGRIREYIDTRFLVLAEYDFRRKGVEEIYDYLSKRPSLAFGPDHSGEFLNFYGFHNTNHSLGTPMPIQDDGIEVGRFVREGILETELPVRIAKSSMNLGFVITGLPGSGKTREAMSVIDRLHAEGGMHMAIITPTPEWKEFAESHGMYVIRPYLDSTPINFFRRPGSIEPEKFYSNLAMILSSAADAGPYQRPMEKCMLNAFRKCYSDDDQPEPAKVYGEIEQSIVKYHGKQGPSGIKYTKHGENIKSSLENLRGIVSKEQYCVRDGIRLEEMLPEGVLFDLSATSAGTRTQLYALILNQIYSIADGLDSRGDGELRLLICLEEAQTIFGDERSPAVQDIKYRIQDFRKQGIGLMLLTHNVSDIDVGIRRLCQLKLYLKQAPDNALVASKDLIFSGLEQDKITLKLKTLGSGVGAFSSISKSGTHKRQQDTVFIRTNEYNEIAADGNDRIGDYLANRNLRKASSIKCRLKLSHMDYKDLKGREMLDYRSVRISYLGEEIATMPLARLAETEIYLIEGMPYTVDILDKRERIARQWMVRASEQISIGLADQ